MNKRLLLSAIWFLSLCPLPCFAKNYRTIELNRQSLESHVSSVTNATADHALRIASFLFSSKEFQDTLSNLSCNYHNLCNDCDTNTVEGQPDIPGQRILDSIFRKQTVYLKLLLEKVGKPPIKLPFGRKKCFGLGATCPNQNFITSYYKNIQCDMSEDLPFDYAYAVHLCHEFTHNVGYCHTYQDDDIAEAVGWIAFYYIDLWYKAGKRIP